MERYKQEETVMLSLLEEAGTRLKEGRTHSLTYWAKAPNDLVSAMDLKMEEWIVRRIQSIFPEDHFLSEETYAKVGEKERIWILDPLDGTVNYIRNIPCYCISLALCVRGEVVLGGVYNPVQREMYRARRGQGAFCNDEPLKVHEGEDIQGALLATEYVGYEGEKGHLLTRLGQTVGHLRMPGSQAMGLAYVARGLCDVAYFPRTNPWDFAAGSLLITEAGGALWAPGGFSPLTSREILAGFLPLTEALVPILEERNG